MNLTDIMTEKAIIEDQLNNLKARYNEITYQIESHLKEKIEQKRQEKGSDTGTIHVITDGWDVSHTIPKKVSWDQDGLASLVQKISEHGDNPSLYIDTKYSVKENNYNKWERTIQDTFKPFRVVEPGKAKLELKPVQ